MRLDFKQLNKLIALCEELGTPLEMVPEEQLTKIIPLVITLTNRLEIQYPELKELIEEK